MPRTLRASSADFCYHVLNRGNARATVFHDDDDYKAFVELIGEACDRLPTRVLAYGLMPNHFHLVLKPHGDGDLSRWMQWLLTSHVRRHHRRYRSSGHVWQGRFKAFPTQDDGHLLAVLRYVERNPLRAGLVPRAEDWPWSSLALVGSRSRPSYFDPGPRPRRAAWLRRVNAPMTEAELASLRRCIERGAPFGTDAWSRQAAEALGLQSSLRPLGRPKKAAAE
ncbi:MAG: rayT [Planctomycetota bacterium]|nr:rayT [Planctomycetota bacterium]